MKGVLALMDSPTVMGAVKKGVLKDIDPSRLYDAVNVILTLQNEDGGKFSLQHTSMHNLAWSLLIPTSFCSQVGQHMKTIVDLAGTKNSIQARYLEI